jgi:hypothetical protein
MLLAAVGALALTTVSAPADAQMSMPGMHMPMPTKKKPLAKKGTAKKPTVEKSTAKAAAPMNMPMPPQSGAHGSMPQMGTMPMQQGQMTMPMGAHGDHMMNMTGAFGPYPMERES